jgi:hypothetical protein
MTIVERRADKSDRSRIDRSEQQNASLQKRNRTQLRVSPDTYMLAEASRCTTPRREPGSSGCCHDRSNRRIPYSDRLPGLIDVLRFDTFVINIRHSWE